MFNYCEWIELSYCCFDFVFNELLGYEMFSLINDDSCAELKKN